MEQPQGSPSLPVGSLKEVKSNYLIAAQEICPIQVLSSACLEGKSNRLIIRFGLGRHLGCDATHVSQFLSEAAWRYFLGLR